MRATVTNSAGKVVARRSVANGSEPWASEVRLKPGTYRVTTTSICPDQTRSRTQRIKITVKTDRTTVSAGEWKKIKKGMTKAKVRRIVGTLGDQWADLSFIERTSYQRYAMIDWSKSGKVQRKIWDAPRD